jgi:hypothetical protein
MISLGDFVTAAARHVRDGNNNIVFFLGAGCSRAAGIPLASELMDRWASEGIVRSTSYSTMLEARYPMRSMCSHAFRKLCKNRQPTEGHRALAQLFASFPAQIRLCLTTNFDGLVEEAIDQRNHADGNQRHMWVHHQQGKGAATALRHHLGQDSVFGVVKLLGDAPSDTYSSKHGELDFLPAEPVCLEIQRKPTMLVFNGYGGNDSGVVAWLREIGVMEGGVYWCSQNEPAGLIAPWLREKHYHHVVHRDFDEIMAALGYRREKKFKK